MNHQNSSNSFSSSSSMILDRFRSLLNQREEQIAAEMISNDADDDDNDNDVYNVLNTEDIVELYEIVLSDLTSNSKPVIGELTMIAKEHRNHAHGIAHAICNRVFEVPSEQKLSSLYLLDSIVKNVGCEYVSYFASSLPEMFCETYRQVHPKLHASMRRLFATWSAIFPPSVLHKIEIELQFSALLSHQSPDMNASGCSGSPHTDHGIHVNPKYLEMRKTDPIDNNAHRTAPGRKRKEMDASANAKRWSGASQKFHDGQNGRGFASSLQRYGRQSNIAYEQNDADLSDFTTSHAASQQLGSSRNLSHESSSEKLLSSNTKRRRLPSSPPRIWPARSLSPSNYEFTREDSLERVSPMHPSFAYKHNKLNANDGKNDEFSIEYHPDNYNLNNGFKRQGPRELIDAYGNDERNTTTNENPLKLERISVNGVLNKRDTRRWQNSEEDEYTWEEMSPTLANHGSNDVVPSNLSLENLNNITSLGMRTPLNKPDLRGGNWDPSVTSTELGISILGPDGGSMIGGGTQHTTQNQDFRYSKQPWMKKELSAQSSHSNSMSLSPASTVNFSSGRPQSPPKAPLAYHPGNMGTSHRSSLLTSLPQHEQMKDHVGLMDGHRPLMDQCLLPNQQAGLTTSNQEHHRQTATLWPQVLQPQNVHETYIPSLPAQVSSSFIVHPWNHGHTPILHGGALRSIPSNQISRIPSSSANLHHRSDTSFHAHEGPLPLPPVASLPNSLKIVNTSQNISPAASGLPASNVYSSLINSLMAQGLLPVAPSASAKDSVGVEFNPDLLKVRYESSIKALYGDLPRKCTTCGLRFKCQELHRSHMDWHVTKNRASKNRKHKPSRKWFVSTSVWLSGAEAVGSDAVPGFWSKEAEVEEKDQKEIAVPADEQQNACALCGEPFDDFYSDETEEWMYRDALYLNAPNGSTNMERSQLGPIVHAKCRSESEVIT